MTKYLNRILKNITVALEFVISFILATALCVMIYQLITTFGHLPDLQTYPNYDDLLTSCFNLIIGIEMIRMIYLHTQSTVFEVLLFAIARQIIIDHSDPLHSLIGVVSISILFATRKFLFVAFDESEKTIFRASQKVRLVNALLHIHIPYEAKDESLEDVFRRQLAEEETPQDIGIGTCIYYHDFGFRISKMHEDKISRIEVIRSIH